MNVTLRIPALDAAREMVLAVVPREGEVVQLDDGPWIVRRVVHYPAAPGQPPRPPYVVLRHPLNDPGGDRHGAV